MITATKAQALLMFAHSRLSNKMSETTNMDEMIRETASALKKDNFTIDHLNSLPNCYTTSQMTYYYELCQKTLAKSIKQGEEWCEEVIGLALLEWLTEKKKVVKLQSKYLISQIIEKIGNIQGKEDRVLVFKMRIVAQRVIKALDGANYAKWSKQQRKRGRK